MHEDHDGFIAPVNNDDALYGYEFEDDEGDERPDDEYDDYYDWDEDDFDLPGSNIAQLS